jgi:glycosyltransferase involved in cell wall biosynthesis
LIKHVTDSRDKNRPLIAIGGGVVEIDEQGRPFAKAAIADYLHALAEVFGGVHFFAYAVPKTGELFETPLDLERIHLHQLRWPHARGLGARWRAFHADVGLLRRTAARAAGIIEYHPAGGGWPISLLLARFAPFYVVYFGLDSRKRWMPLGGHGPLGVLKRLHLLITGEVTARLADLVLVRDVDQWRRIERQRPGRVVLSSPISAALQTPVVRADSCQNETVRLLCVCVLSRRKGIEDLLQAVHLLAHDPQLQERLQGRRVQLTLVGGGTLQEGYTLERVREIAAELGIAEQVTLTGYLDDIERLRQIYQEADIFVLASHSEGFPRVFDEAMSHNLPIVTTNLVEMRATLTHRVHAMMVEPGQPRPMAEALCEVITDGELRRTLLRNSHALALSRLGDTAAVQHARLMLELAAQKRQKNQGRKPAAEARS